MHGYAQTCMEIMQGEYFPTEGGKGSAVCKYALPSSTNPKTVQPYFWFMQGMVHMIFDEAKPADFSLLHISNTTTIHKRITIRAFSTIT